MNNGHIFYEKNAVNNCFFGNKRKVMKKNCEGEEKPFELYQHILMFTSLYFYIKNRCSNTVKQ